MPNGTSLYGFDEYNSFDQLKDSRAVFLNATYEVVPSVTLRGGARFTHDRVTITHLYAMEGGLLPPGSVGYGPDSGTTEWTQTIGALPATYSSYQTSLAPPGPTTSRFEDNNNVSLRAGVDWKPTDDVLTYATFSEGYRGAAFNGQAFNNPVEANFAAPEKLYSYEIGLKSELWNRHLIFNAALFHYDYHNQQFLDAFALPGGAGSGFHTVNAPKSRVDGAEFEVRVRTTEALELNAALGLMHSKYVDLTLHAGELETPGVVRVCCVGNQLIQAPNYTASGGVNWRFAQLAAGDLRLLVDANFYGKQYFDAFNTERIAQSPYGIGNARLSFDSSQKRGFAVDAWIKNFTNKRYLAYGLNQRDLDTGALGFDYALVGEPRTYGADLTYRF
jgi:iron complex outermembrane receptor protein